jgi:hypothetical protein
MLTENSALTQDAGKARVACVDPPSCAEQDEMESPPPYEIIASTLEVELANDCRAMLRYALASGQEIPVEILNAFARLSTAHRHKVEEIASLGLLHTLLVRLVAPATPLGIRLLQEDEHQHRALHMLGPVPSIRWLMLAGIIFSLTFFGISLSPLINRETLSRDIYDLSGITLIIPLLFLLSAAGLGATFGALFEAYQFVSEGHFDARFDCVYWARIGLGLVSGLMLAELLPASGGTKLLERPLLALLGGFSVAVVHRILQRLVNSVESFFLAEAKTIRPVQEPIREKTRPVVNSDAADFARALKLLLEHEAESKPRNAAAAGRAHDHSALRGSIRKEHEDAGTKDLAGADWPTLPGGNLDRC